MEGVAGCGVEQVRGALGPQDAQQRAAAAVGELVEDGVQAWSVRPDLVDVDPPQPPAAPRQVRNHHRVELLRPRRRQWGRCRPASDNGFCSCRHRGKEEERPSGRRLDIGGAWPYGCGRPLPLRLEGGESVPACRWWHGRVGGSSGQRAPAWRWIPGGWLLDMRARLTIWTSIPAEEVGGRMRICAEVLMNPAGERAKAARHGAAIRRRGYSDFVSETSPDL